MSRGQRFAFRGWPRLDVCVLPVSRSDWKFEAMRAGLTPPERGKLDAPNTGCSACRFGGRLASSLSRLRRTGRPPMANLCHPACCRRMPLLTNDLWREWFCEVVDRAVGRHRYRLGGAGWPFRPAGAATPQEAEIKLCRR